MRTIEIRTQQGNTLTLQAVGVVGSFISIDMHPEELVTMQRLRIYLINGEPIDIWFHKHHNMKAVEQALRPSMVRRLLGWLIG